MASDDEIPTLQSDVSDDSEDDEVEVKVEKYPPLGPQAPYSTKNDSGEDIPELLDGDDDDDDEDDDEEPPPLVGEDSDDEDESDNERPPKVDPGKKDSHGPSLPGLKAGFFAKPKPQPTPSPAPAFRAPPAEPAKPPPAEPAKPPPAARDKMNQVPQAAPRPSPFTFTSPAPTPPAKSAPPPAAKPKTGPVNGQAKDGSDGNDSDEVPDLLDADEDEDDDTGFEDNDENSEAEQESEEEDQPRPAHRPPRGATWANKNFYDETEERAAEERRRREAKKRRREEERARERAEKRRKELEEKRRRRAEAREREKQDAQVYENTPEARELAEQARLRAEAEFEEKRLQMGLGPREKASTEEEEWIGNAYVCRGTHCPGGQRKLSKSMEYIEYTCTERCLLVYHTGDCHRKDVKLRMEREHGVWKEEEGARCITPDCPGTLTKGTKWNRYGKVSYQIIDPEKYEKKRREKERQRAEEKAARQAAAQKRYKKREKAEEEEPEGNARFTRSARSRTFTTVSFTGATGPVAEPVPEETGQGEAKEEKAEPEEPHRKRGKKKNAEAGGAPVADANGGEGGAGPSGRQEESGGGGAPGIAVLVKAPLRAEGPSMAERSGEESLVVKEYRKKEDEDNVFTLGNRDRTKDKGKQKVDAVPEAAPVAAKGKGKNKRMNILDFITSDDPEPAPRPPPHASNARLHMNGLHPRGPVPVVQRPAQEEFPVRGPRESRESTSAFQRLGPLSEFMKPLRSFLSILFHCIHFRSKYKRRMRVCGVRGVETSGPKELFAFPSEGLPVPDLSKADYDYDNGGTKLGPCFADTRLSFSCWLQRDDLQASEGSCV